MTVISLLNKEKDEKFKKFSEKIVSDTKYPILGVKVPIVREIAKKTDLSGITEIPENGFTYYEECLLYGLVFAGSKKFSFNDKIALLNKYLVYVDSWGITDSVAAAFKDVKKNREQSTELIYSLLKSPLTYTRRFGIVLLTLYFTGEYFKKEQLDKIINAKTGEYYVDMAIAWYVSVLLVKNRNAAVNIIEKKVLPPFIHNKAIQKAVESFRVSEPDKIRLKKLKIKTVFNADYTRRKNER